MLPPLGDERPVLQVTCGFGLTQELCHELATHHIFWTEVENSITCDKHFEYARQYDWHDHHPMTQVCTAPDIRVTWSWDDPPGYCQWVVSEDTLELSGAEIIEKELQNV